MNITLQLPEALVAEAQAAGILTDERIAELLTIELERRKRGQQLLDDMQKLDELQPALTKEEIKAEIKLAQSLPPEERARRLDQAFAQFREGLTPEQLDEMIAAMNEEFVEPSDDAAWKD